MPQDSDTASSFSLTVQLVRDMLRSAGSRAIVAGGLLVAGSLLELAGVLLLVPIIQVLLGEEKGPAAAFQDSLNAFGVTSPSAQVGAVLLLFGLLIGLRFLVLLRRDSELARLRTDFVADLRARAFAALAVIPWSDLAGRGHGRIGHALARDVDRVSNTAGIVLAGGLSLLQIAVQLSVSFALAPAITAGVVVLGWGVFLALRFLRRRAALQGIALTEADFELFNTATTYLRGVKSARAHGLEAEYGATFGAAARRVARELLRQERDYSLARVAAQSMVAIIGLAAVAAGAFLVPVAPETLVVVILILARLSGPFQAVQEGLQSIGYSAAAYRAVLDLTDEVQDRPARAAPARTERLDHAPTIRFRDVSFVAGETELLSGIDCTIEAGRITALTGPSGAGKSLFCDLAVGLLSPQSGRVELDGAPLEEEAVVRLRRSLSYITQEPLVLEDTLRANLTWGCGEVSDDEIWNALEAVGATTLARNLNGGLDGSMRAGGSRFSGGERQRFRLANALLRRPGFLVLDEATNALDLESEMAVLQNLRLAAPGATLLMLTHRLSTLALADHVLLLERGQLSWAGPPDAFGPAAGLRLSATQADPAADKDLC